MTPGMDEEGMRIRGPQDGHADLEAEPIGRPGLEVAGPLSIASMDAEKRATRDEERHPFAGLEADRMGTPAGGEAGPRPRDPVGRAFHAIPAKPRVGNIDGGELREDDRALGGGSGVGWSQDGEERGDGGGGAAAHGTFSGMQRRSRIRSAASFARSARRSSESSRWRKDLEPSPRRSFAWALEVPPSSPASRG